LKTAIIKQAYDVFGPWAGVLWKDTSPQKIFELWPNKAVYWELTCILQADWYIIPQTFEGDYIRDVVRDPARARVVDKYVRNVTPVQKIPLSDYDLVISIDPILQPPKQTGTLFAYYAQEHWDRLYSQSMKKPYPGYDLFLDHMMDAPEHIDHLPQAYSFPYIHNPQFARSQFCPPRQEVVWVDFRTLMTLAMKGLGGGAVPEAKAAADRLEKTLGIETRCATTKHTKAWGIQDPPWWGDAANYFRELAECKYYVGVGTISGAGQGLAEGAAFGCLCIGQADKAYHRLLCHPHCLCQDMAEMPAKFRDLARNSDFQSEVLAWQDKHLIEHFHKRPLDALTRAIEMKGKT
jgi:hypothetical protein